MASSDSAWIIAIAVLIHSCTLGSVDVRLSSRDRQLLRSGIEALEESSDCTCQAYPACESVEPMEKSDGRTSPVH